MKKTFKIFGFVVLVVVIGFFACSASNDGKVINSADALKEYLDSQPANDPDKPIKVIMNVNDLMLNDIAKVIDSAGKFVTLDLSRSSGLTTIGEGAFQNNKALTGIILPESVSNIGKKAFMGSSLISINIPSSVNDFGEGAFSDCKSLTSLTWSGHDNSSFDGTSWLFVNGGDVLEYEFNNGVAELTITAGGPFPWTAKFDTFYFIKDGVLRVGDVRYRINGNTFVHEGSGDKFTRQ